MKRICQMFAVAALAALVPISGVQAASSTSKMVMLHLSSKFMHKAGFAHATGHATLKFAQHDVTISVTADNLPSASMVGGRVYVVFASDGSMTAKVGTLKTTGSMAAVKGQVMMSKVHDIYVYAAGSASVKHPSGTLIMSAMV